MDTEAAYYRAKTMPTLGMQILRCCRADPLFWTSTHFAGFTAAALRGIICMVLYPPLVARNLACSLPARAIFSTKFAVPSRIRNVNKAQTFVAECLGYINPPAPLEVCQRPWAVFEHTTRGGEDRQAEVRVVGNKQ